MNKKRIALFCSAALVAAGIGLNIQNALADYGIGENSFSLIADPSSCSGSNTNTFPNMSDSDSNGNGTNVIKYHKAKGDCLYKCTGPAYSTLTFTVKGILQQVDLDENGKGEKLVKELVDVCLEGGTLPDCENEPCPQPSMW